MQDIATTKDFLVVRVEGKRQVSRSIRHYNLDAIIAVGYRINSHRATQFRIWATSVLKEYIIKGFALDDKRLKKGGNPFGEDFDKAVKRLLDGESPDAAGNGSGKGVEK